MQVEVILLNSATAAWTLGLPGVHCEEALGGIKGEAFCGLIFSPLLLRS